MAFIFGGKLFNIWHLLPSEQQNRKIITFAKMKSMQATAKITLNESYFDELMLIHRQPSRISHADGYVSLDENGDATFYYYLTDHLGNVRSVITPDTDGRPQVEQANDYFPFGMSFESRLPYLTKSGSTRNKFKYNGKEILAKISSNAVTETFFEGNASSEVSNVDYANKQEALEEAFSDNAEKLNAGWYRDSRGRVPGIYIKHYLRSKEYGGISGQNPWADDDSLTDSTTVSDPNYEQQQYYYHPDHLGSTTCLTDVLGETYQYVAYLPWGEIFVEERNTQTDRNPYLYNGKELDEMTGLYYYGARYYDASLARFHTIDPLAEDYSFQSPFAYAANNPICYIDWMGMGPGNAPEGTTHFYFRFRGSFGPQLGLSLGDVFQVLVRGANVIGETKIGITITPEGKPKFLFLQSSKNVNYEVKASAAVAGLSKSSEYGIKEHPSMAVEKKEKQVLLTKITTTESDEIITENESTGYELGIGVNAILLGIGIDIGFEYTQIESTIEKTAETQTVTPKSQNKGR